MRCDEMRWDEMSWDEMRWDELRWDEMRWDEMRRFWIHPFLDKVQLCWLWYAAYDSAADVNFLCFRLIWCLCRIGRGLSWSLHETFYKSSCTSVIINWLLRLIYEWPYGRKGWEGDITYWSLLVAEHNKCSDILLFYVYLCHEVINMRQFPHDLLF